MDPLEGKTLKFIIEYLVDKYGWEGLASRIRINCFAHEPSVNSSLTFLRKTDWARKKVENLYIKASRMDEHPPKYKKPQAILGASYFKDLT